MSNIQTTQYEVYRPPMARIKNENQFDIMIKNITDSSIYKIIYPKIEEYITIHHKKPLFKKYSGGVEFCQINNAEYPSELDRLLNEYSQFYPKKIDQEYYSYRNIKNKDREIKKLRNYGPEGMIEKLNTVEGLSDVYNNRIKGLKDCKGKINTNLEKEEGSRYFLLEETKLRDLKEFYNPATQYVGVNIALDNLTINKLSFQNKKIDKAKNTKVKKVKKKKKKVKKKSKKSLEKKVKQEYVVVGNSMERSQQCYKKIPHQTPITRRVAL
jgi:hypothetical protein